MEKKDRPPRDEEKISIRSAEQLAIEHSVETPLGRALAENFGPKDKRSLSERIAIGKQMDNIVNAAPLYNLYEHVKTPFGRNIASAVDPEDTEERIRIGQQCDRISTRKKTSGDSQER